MKIMNALNFLVQQKVDRYNRARDDIKISQSKMYFYQLQGIQEAIKIMGFDLDLFEDGLKLSFKIST